MVELIEINETAEYIKHICKLNDSDRMDEFTMRNVYLFRGQPNMNYELLPSLARYEKLKVEKSGEEYRRDFSLQQIEINLIGKAKFKRPDVFSNSLLPIELLSLLQHHGIPTRLLDVTENPLVALYFACISDFDTSGEVIVFLSKEYQVDNPPIINAIADSYRLIKCMSFSIDAFFQKAIEHAYFLEQKLDIEALCKTASERNDWIEKCCQEPMFVYSPNRTLRQQAQQGRYILFPNKIDWIDKKKSIKGFYPEIEPISKDHERIVKMRLIIPPKKKKDILDELKLQGISGASLFPDNIDKVCEEIKETYF